MRTITTVILNEEEKEVLNKALRLIDIISAEMEDTGTDVEESSYNAFSALENLIDALNMQ